MNKWKHTDMIRALQSNSRISVYKTIHIIVYTVPTQAASSQSRIPLNEVKWEQIEHYDTLHYLQQPLCLVLVALTEYSWRKWRWWKQRHLSFEAMCDYVREETEKKKGTAEWSGCSVYRGGVVMLCLVMIVCVFILLTECHAAADPHRPWAGTRRPQTLGDGRAWSTPAVSTQLLILLKGH